MRFFDLSGIFRHTPPPASAPEAELPRRYTSAILEVYDKERDAPDARLVETHQYIANRVTPKGRPERFAISRQYAFFCPNSGPLVQVTGGNGSMTREQMFAKLQEYDRRLLDDFRGNLKLCGLTADEFYFSPVPRPAPGGPKLRVVN